MTQTQLNSYTIQCRNESYQKVYDDSMHTEMLLTYNAVCELEYAHCHSIRLYIRDRGYYMENSSIARAINSAVSAGMIKAIGKYPFGKGGRNITVYKST